MSFHCSQLEDALREENPALLAAAREHARECPACGQELAEWDALSELARGLHHDWESPGLWYRIQETVGSQPRKGESFGSNWRLVLVTAAMLILGVASVWLVRREEVQTTASRQFLTEQALRDVEKSEAAYVQSIEKLSKVADPVLTSTPSPLMASYREKLVVLDSAIRDLRAAAETNQLNAQLRGELLALYQEKQQTLTEVLRHANDRDSSSTAN